MTDADPAQSDDRSVWLRSEPDPDGRYIATLSVGPDHVLHLDRDEATAWAAYVAAAVAAAEYDAAIYDQIGDKKQAPILIQAMRYRRRSRSTAPGRIRLELVPGVSHRTRRGFLAIHVAGVLGGQWELEDARDHAFAALQVAAVAELDNDYHAVLKRVGITDESARALIQDVAAHRAPFSSRGDRP